MNQIERLELQWLYKNCPAWGGHLERGEPVQLNSQLWNYLGRGLIAPTEGGYCLTQKGVWTAFDNQ